MSQVQQLLESAASGWKNMQSDAAKLAAKWEVTGLLEGCLLYTSPSPRDRQKSRMPSSA